MGRARCFMAPWNRSYHQTGLLTTRLSGDHLAYRKQGAIASSVAHDSHNIVAVGVDDESICKAINLIIRDKGGISCVNHQKEMILGLPVAGLMSMEDGYEVAKKYTAIDAMAKSLGSRLSAPFMTLSFMALLVIPHLKLSDKGLFDGDTFSFVNNDL